MNAIAALPTASRREIYMMAVEICQWEMNGLLQSKHRSKLKEYLYIYTSRSGAVKPVSIVDTLKQII